MTHQPLRKRFWIEAVCGGLGAALFVLTLVSKEWIEVIFGVDPDHGSGALEVTISVGLLAVAAVSSVLARREWRRPAIP
jgi:hypothetical protein